MKRFMKIGLLMALAFVLLGAYRYVSAQEEHSQAGKMPGPPPPVFTGPPPGTDAPATKHVLVATYYTAGSLGGTSLVPDTLTPVDTPQTISCPGTSGTCLIIADHWLELSSGSGGGEVAGCLYVDGVADSFCEYNEGELPVDGSYNQFSSSHATSGVSHGSHTVQTYVICYNGCNAAYYHINYRIYKP